MHFDRRRRVDVLLGMLVAATGAGCSGDDQRLVEVTGEVTFNGRPVVAEVIFEPQHGGRPSSALTDSSGAYRLRYTAERTGAVIGPHRVTLKILRDTPTDETLSFTETVTPVKVTRLVREVAEKSNHLRFSVRY